MFALVLSHLPLPCLLQASSSRTTRLFQLLETPPTQTLRSGGRPCAHTGCPGPSESPGLPEDLKADGGRLLHGPASTSGSAPQTTQPFRQRQGRLAGLRGVQAGVRELGPPLLHRGPRFLPQACLCFCTAFSSLTPTSPCPTTLPAPGPPVHWVLVFTMASGPEAGTLGSRPHPAAPPESRVGGAQASPPGVLGCVCER